MTLADAVSAEPLLLLGEPRARGLAQARLRPELVGHVRHAIAHRLEETKSALARADVRNFIRAERDFTASHYPEILQEIEGIAAGFGLEPELLLDYLHCSTAMDLAELEEHRPDGCTALAFTAERGHAVVAKNRDYRAEHIPIQQVMLHRDPAWDGREIMVLGSLGSPGNFSSGMNSDGLAVADTASRTTDMGPGFHRYFLLTWLLVHCATVDEAIAAIRRTTHTGSGLLVMGDATGAVAAVELGHRAIGFEQHSSGRVGRTNHFVTPHMAPRNLVVPSNAASRANSARRLPCLRHLLTASAEPIDAGAAAAILAYHGEALPEIPRGEAFCRHGGDQLSTTISGAIWATGERCLYLASGNPCTASWRRYDLTSSTGREAAE